MSTGLRFTLEVDGLPPDAFAVVSFHLNQSLSSLFSLDLSLVSQQFLSLEFQQILDKMAYLTIWQGDDVQRRVKGVVTWFELGENDKNQMLYSMKVHPPLWRAGLRQNFRIFQNEDIKSILGTMLQENGVTEWSPLFSEPHPSREFCVQYGETDYDFLCRMAAEEGIFFYEDHAYKSTDQSLVLCDTVRHLPESFEIPWNPNTRTEVSTLCISQFRYSAQIRPSSVVTKDYTFKRPGWAGRFDQEGQYQDYQRTQYEVYDYPGRFKGAHGQNFARWQMDGWRNNAEVARGTSRSPEIWPGRRIALTGHPQANLNREWQVVALVTECGSDGNAVISLRNKFRTGDTVELVGPDLRPFSMTVPEMRDEAGTVIEEPRNPQMLLKLRLPRPVPPMTLVRHQVELSAK